MVIMKTRRGAGLAGLALTLVVFGSVLGAGTGCKKPAYNPTGTWRVTFTRDGQTQSYQPTLKLKLAGDVLTGTFTRRRNQEDIEMALEDAKLAAGRISFTVDIPPESAGGPKMMRKFDAKITGDTITEGAVKEDFNGQDPSLDHPLRRGRYYGCLSDIPGRVLSHRGGLHQRRIQRAVYLPACGP